MIVGTAGHVDHGKTALVRALTGTDTDRLPEEKRRGISIELGYAFLDVPAGGRIGLVDVPGHERLVHTMLAGASGIDHALLVVAADDGPMPQTREHLAVLSLLGISRGWVALTKCDRVDAPRIEQAGREVRQLLAGTALEGARIVRTSAATGEGVADLRAELASAAGRDVHSDEGTRGFRLPVDRVFTIKGAGTVVTGSAAAGCVQAGDELAVVPGGRRLRVRTLHAQGAPAQQGRARERLALQVAGAGTGEIVRGQWLCNPAVVLATDRIDARVTVWRDATPLRAGSAVHVHLGAADIMGTVALLDAARELGPGDTALVQLVLRQPTAAWRGDRLVLRDAAAQHTLAGGTVLDPMPPRRYRRSPGRLAELAAHAACEPAQRLRALLAASDSGVDLRAWVRAEGWLVEPPLHHEGVHRAGYFAIGTAQLERMHARMADVLAGCHRAEPGEAGVELQRARRMVAPLSAPEAWELVVAEAVAAGRLVRHGPVLALPEHDARLGAADERIAARVLPQIEAAAFDPPWLSELALHIGESEDALRPALLRLARRGELHQVVPDLFFSHASLCRLAAAARSLADAEGSVRAADLRDATGMRRKRVVQVLEYFDRTGLLRRAGDRHYLRGGTAIYA
ncbi:MAG: selenocysteine-specific translation elongation factor [Burkholderiales bacterium]|nr:selenocysteine-specific translation elongation factor [Burkholderiales bacterium]